MTESVVKRLEEEESDNDCDGSVLPVLDFLKFCIIASGYRMYNS